MKQKIITGNRKAAIYIRRRENDTDPENDLSVKTQIRKASNYMREKGIPFGKFCIVNEGKYGFVTSSKWNQLIESLSERKDIGFIIFQRWDVFLKHDFNVLDEMLALHKMKIQIRCLDQPIRPWLSKTRLKSMMAEYSRKNRTRKAHRELIQAILLDQEEL